MILYQITSEGLAHHSYYIGSGRSAAVIDPRRDVEIYLKTAFKLNQRITHIFETHRNEDYVIGSKELQSRCDAGIYHGCRLAFSYGNIARDGDTFSIGDIRISVLETPGHTPESISLVLTDIRISEGPLMVFTGDALFAGDVGRTDLMGTGREEEAAGLLFESLKNKIIPLGDGVLVYPAHGAGSTCGIDIADHQVSSIGYEKKTNRFLAMDRDRFIQYKVREEHYIPPYFRMMEQLNLEGARVLGHPPDIMALTPREVREGIGRGAQVIDIRSPTSFAGGHIPGSLCIWRDGIPAFMGWFLNYEDPVIVIDDFNLALDPVFNHFVRMGYDNLSGYLSGGFPSWYKAGELTSHQSCWTVQDLKEALDEGREEMFLLDVRDIHNREKTGHIHGDHHIYVGLLPENLELVPRDTHVVVYCDAGYKGCLATGFLGNNGYRKVTNTLGGMTGWVAAGFPVEK